MSDQIKHECGVAFIRLLKPLSFYQKKYGTALYGLNKLYLLMEKQHNRGQDGAGVATIKLDIEPGKRYISRHRSMASNAVADIFEYIQKKFAEIQKETPEKMADTEWLKEHVSFTGEVLLGHLRYGTHGKNSIENCHPFLRQNNWMTRNLVIAGNFNMTNVDELLQQLYDLGQHPKEKADTVTVLEKMGHFIDTEVQGLFDQYKREGLDDNAQISKLIANDMDVAKILRKSAKNWDGGYTIAGILGHGDAFVMRDPVGIRPAYYYYNDEIVVAASERPAIMTAFNIPIEEIKEIKPGHALIVKKDGKITEDMFSEPLEKKACSFERIYFSRGSDASIYKERKQLGRLLCPQILDAVENDVKNTVFSYIPNTAEVAFYGMVEGIHKYIKKYQRDRLLNRDDKISEEELTEVLALAPRVEKIAIKDVKLRTFITQDADRSEMVAHVYDTTYGLINKDADTLVVLDDSIVRGTTLKQSILKILDRLGPKKVVVVSSAPQIRYPDCYGIDMSRMGEFVAFEAAISLLKEQGKENIIVEVYQKCKDSSKLAKEDVENYVKAIYAPFTDQEVSDRIAKIITPPNITAKVQVIYQTLDNLHIACPDHAGDWYFSGDYPTPGGNKVVNRAFVNWMEGNNQRAYM
ncbi:MULTISPECIES: class II glutamine amidotransferase [unclassified Mucilaginibacter]|uniref:class II glutamine amidotransferase n=1 Tax=unclassified Mucilaginibacter TaxID=2617802 RepID=UPI002AC91637|nr:MULTISPECIES: class II glutamine amidotransferase [unclassified Mucilaginibacter]MEB0248983.1 class II glutamine amidotransferase [Mucilaginibacter sp. 5B2]MEB0261489.1 class II glutamine amidotransferase [Mucilaginibacter sp. 10I4]MEB0276925.1 class II glutamine amidotransferase [Mucilaginibacter sp. 10B2]MEB0300755.1 class II glutamine amidotransferase [Mucilaginibacter sp. 5C4]WPX25025.1 class II glutamine amidotransferase [Mucilaginibacter sp. 5C4]